MQGVRWVVGVCWALTALAGCNQAKVEAPVPKEGSAGIAGAAAPAAVEFDPAASIVEIMGNVIDPAADALWQSYSTKGTAQGVVHIEPTTDADWQGLRRQALLLIEGANLLMIEGRVVARPGEKRENPPSEGDLTPEQSLAAINAHRSNFNAFAHVLQSTATQTMAAIDTRDLEKFAAMLDQLDEACEACHKVFWYPDARR